MGLAETCRMTTINNDGTYRNTTVVAKGFYGTLPGQAMHAPHCIGILPAGHSQKCCAYRLGSSDLTRDHACIYYL